MRILFLSKKWHSIWESGTQYEKVALNMRTFFCSFLFPVHLYTWWPSFVLVIKWLMLSICFMLYLVYNRCKIWMNQLIHMSGICICSICICYDGLFVGHYHYWPLPRLSGLLLIFTFHLFLLHYSTNFHSYLKFSFDL